MADVSVKAVSPRVTLDLDLEEAKALKFVLDERLSSGVGGRNPKLSSIQSELRSGINMADSIVKGAGYVQEAL